jgi:hypothetical protein
LGALRRAAKGSAAIEDGWRDTVTEATPYPYPAAAAPWQPDGPGAPDSVLLAVAGPAAQRRATVAVRLILAIPHLFALYFLGIAALVVAVIGWFGALVTGRLPRFAATYLSGYLRWYARAGAYLLLLTDEYPPFTLGDAAYPAQLTVRPGRLSRLTVVFRIILAIPAAVVSMLLAYGLMTIVIFVGWLTALIAGRLPASLHQAFAAVLRYTVRYDAYLYLVTGAYPAGLFGDKPAAPPGADFTGPDANWRLVLIPGAKRLVGAMLVLGLLIVAGGAAWDAAMIRAARERAREISQLDADVARFDATVARHNAAVTAEQLAASQVSNASTVLGSAHATALGDPASDASQCGTISCFSAASRADAADFAAFGRTLKATPVPPGAAALAKRLFADTTGLEQNDAEVEAATSFDSIVTIETAGEKVAGHWDSDYADLMAAIDIKSRALGSEALQLNTAATTLTKQGAALERRAAALNVPINLRTANPGSLGQPADSPILRIAGQSAMLPCPSGGTDS